MSATPSSNQISAGTTPAISVVTGCSCASCGHLFYVAPCVVVPLRSVLDTDARGKSDHSVDACSYTVHTPEGKGGHVARTSKCLLLEVMLHIRWDGMGYSIMPVQGDGSPLLLKHVTGPHTRWHLFQQETQTTGAMTVKP